MRRRIANNVADMVIPPAPACFDTRSAWQEYVLNAAKAKRRQVYVINQAGSPEMKPDFDFCRDCTMMHQIKMTQVGRCQRATKKDALDKAIIEAATGKTARQIEETQAVEDARKAAKIAVRARINHLVRTGALIKGDWQRYFAVQRADARAA